MIKEETQKQKILKRETQYKVSSMNPKEVVETMSNASRTTELLETLSGQNAELTKKMDFWTE